MTKHDFEATSKLTKKYLIDHGFRYMRDYSDDTEKAYSYRFPVYRYQLTVLLDCEILVYLPSNEVLLNVFEKGGSNARYAPWYYYEYGEFTPILTIIDNNINKEIQKFGIRRKDDSNSRRHNVPSMHKKHSPRKPKKENND